MSQVSTVPARPGVERLATCRDAAYRIRMGVLEQGEAQGEGYVGQGLGAADVLAVLYADVLHHRADDPDWADRDRFLLSTGHYALLMYAALAEAGVIPREELTTYAADGSRLPMSAMSTYTPGVEISGGSLGHGLGLAVGHALGLRHQGRVDQRVFCLFSDGELNEGSTWEAAMSASSWELGNLVGIVDMNGLQADGRTSDVLRNEPQVDRWTAFGWDAQRVDGNDVGALLEAFDCATSRAGAHGRPQVLVCDTTVGKGVPLLENRERLHFMKIAPEEWPVCKDQLTAGYSRGRHS
ncbi:transketolase [Angustibacter sp. Root456]|uniref:transketolase n=1 Tax=Angustibacter sp. Root456 TaxID=1736539 RepID=UPI0006F5666A|nr:transketolase [Angustibacter sp. Root456]KQX61885.1 transketolase [Angustibacter sp. Root456]